MTLIWGLRDADKAADDEMQRRAELLLKQLDDQEAEVVISSITASELLTPLDDKEQKAFLDRLNKLFRVVPFDIKAAALAAQLYQRHKGALAKARGYSRTVLRADSLIIASVKVAGASVFYSNDKQCRALASNVMDARDLPTHSEFLFE